MTNRCDNLVAVDERRRDPLAAFPAGAVAVGLVLVARAVEEEVDGLLRLVGDGLAQELRRELDGLRGDARRRLSPHFTTF